MSALNRVADELERLGRSWRRSQLRDDPLLVAEAEARGRPLRKPPFAAYARGIPELAEAFQTKVPTNFWTTVEGRHEVACPCGNTPAVTTFPAPCGSAECPRWYVYDERDVRVAFSPKGGAPVPQDDEDPLSG